MSVTREQANERANEWVSTGASFTDVVFAQMKAEERAAELEARLGRAALLIEDAIEYLAETEQPRMAAKYREALAVLVEQEKQP